MIERAPSRPIMRYYGGKWRLAPWIVEHLPPHRVYVEPFAGAGSVLLHKSRCYAEILNDLDGEIVNLFRVLRDPRSAAELRRLVELTPFSRDEFLAAYEPGVEPVERARRVLVRAAFGMNGVAVGGRSTGFRVEVSNRGTTPSTDWRTWPGEIPAYVERLQGVAIENRDALEVIERFDGHDTLHYVDPPYLDATRTGGAGYRHEFSSLEQHTRLAGALREVRGLVALSGYQSELYDELYIAHGWCRLERRTYAASSAGAVERVDSLWLNPRAVEALENRGPLFAGGGPRGARSEEATWL